LTTLISSRHARLLALAFALSGFACGGDEPAAPGPSGGNPDGSAAGQDAAGVPDATTKDVTSAPDATAETSAHDATVESASADTGTDAASLYNPCPPAGTPCAVMPLGDSITDGAGSSGGGYRVPLFHLVSQDQKTITFVGSGQNGPAMVDGKAFPQHHEGHSGYTIEGTTASRRSSWRR